MKIPLLRLLACLLLLLLPPLAGAASLPEAEVAAARTLFQQGRKDPERNEQAAAAFARLRQADPDNPMLNAYLAGTELLRGHHAWAPWTAIDHVQRGMDHIEAALAGIRVEDERSEAGGLPFAQEARLVAGSCLLDIPESFGAHARGAALIERLAADPAVERYPEDFRAALLVRLAQLAHHAGDQARTRMLLERALALARNELTIAEARENWEALL